MSLSDKAFQADTLFRNYDAGAQEITTEASEVTPEEQVLYLMVLPTTNSYIRLNGSTKDIFLPADLWTPIMVAITSFEIRSIEGTGTAYWQGWMV